ncbi:MAG: hypothetical protein LBV79_04545 [Candidatus Adiutrix sp.]|jgi:hypothetical protein|nr:hypothetical protein [Candidatus Adiutrix sp.]
MNPFYDRAAENILRAVAAKGTLLAIRRYTLENSETATGSGRITLEEQGLLAAIILPGGEAEASAGIRLTEGLVEERSLEILAAAKNAPFEPRPLDEVEYAGLRWLIRAVTPVAPDGTPLLYKMIGVVKQ